MGPAVKAIGAMIDDNSRNSFLIIREVMEKYKLHNPADDDNKNRKSDSEDVSDAPAR